MGGVKRKILFRFFWIMIFEYNYLHLVTICNRLDTYRFCYFYFLLLFVLCGDVTEPEQSKNIYMTYTRFRLTCYLVCGILRWTRNGYIFLSTGQVTMKYVTRILRIIYRKIDVKWIDYYWLLRNFYFEKTCMVGNTYSILVILRDIDWCFYVMGS